MHTFRVMFNFSILKSSSFTFLTPLNRTVFYNQEHLSSIINLQMIPLSFHLRIPNRSCNRILENDITASGKIAVNLSS